ncbi:hypothetical protein BDZ45DRAFT_95224 [Acephala macrosclerotiorum]|nr:hypothetical protein BDZ45DRAFT_95224 [Acephala macrosclerotiorum]
MASSSSAMVGLVHFYLEAAPGYINLELFDRKALSGGDYRQLEDKYDKTSFIQPDDVATTKASIYYTRRKWTSTARTKG